MSADEAKIEIEIRGGMVAAVRTRETMGAIPYQVVDYDTDGAEDDDTDVDTAGDRYTSDGGTTTLVATVSHVHLPVSLSFPPLPNAPLTVPSAWMIT